MIARLYSNENFPLPVVAALRESGRLPKVIAEMRSPKERRNLSAVPMWWQ